MWNWNGKFVWQLRDEYGNVEQEGQCHNMLHRLGQQQVLQAYFAPMGTLLTVLDDDSAYVHGTKTLTAGTAGNFSTVAGETGAGEEDGDYVYVVGGESGTELTTPGVYLVDTSGDDSIIFDADINGGGSVTGGIVVMVTRKFALALDNRSALSVNDTAAGLASYEEDGGGYARASLDPQNSSNWTIAYDSDEDAYTAESAVCTFTASDATWQANRNMALVSHTGTLASPASASEVLIASMSLGGAVTVADTKSITVQYTVPIRGTNT